MLPDADVDEPAPSVRLNPRTTSLLNRFENVASARSSDQRACLRHRSSCQLKFLLGARYYATLINKFSADYGECVHKKHVYFTLLISNVLLPGSSANKTMDPTFSMLSNHIKGRSVLPTGHRNN